MKKFFKAVSTSAAIMAASSVPAFAQEPIKVKEGAIGANIGDLTLSDLVSGLIKLLVIGAAVIFFFMLVLGGIKWIMSGGDKARTEEARNQITAALVGLVVVFAAWAIAQLIKALFDVDLFNLAIPAIKH